MPFIKRLLIKYQADFFGQSSEAVQETWDVRCGATENPEMKKHEGGGEFVSQTVTYGSFVKGLINVIPVSINGRKLYLNNIPL